MAHRFSQNGKPSSEPSPDADSGEYVKNEVDLKLDHLNNLWLKLERQLLKAQPPRRIACKYHQEDTGEYGDVTECRFLGIQRHSGKWRVCYAIVWDIVSTEKLPWKPIVECDVDTRTHATGGIDQLKREVRNTRKVFIPTLDKAIAALQEALNNEHEEE